MTCVYADPVLLIGGGPVGCEQIEQAQRFTNAVVAADSGADTAARCGVAVDVLIGDLDSVSAQGYRDNAQNRIQDPDQNSTDFEKCLKYIRAPLIVGVGFLGGRLDHELAAMNALAKHPAQKVILLGVCDAVFRCPAKLELSLPVGTRVSAFPMGKVSGLSSTGLRYPLEGVEMATEAVIGTSNSTNSATQTIAVETGALLVILPKRHLKQAVRGVHG